MNIKRAPGENFTASDIAASIFSRKDRILVSHLGHHKVYQIGNNTAFDSASSAAVDLGVLVNTKFFSFTGKDRDGMNIGMSISNYKDQNTI